MQTSGLHSTVLTRFSFAQESRLSRVQDQTDGLVSLFVEEAANPRTLAAITVGGMAYRLGSVGVMTIGEGHVAAMPLRIVSMAAGLGSEVTAFEFTNRFLTTMRAASQSPLQDRSPITDHQSPNLWSWSGPGGWKEGLATSALTFGLLRGAGVLAREQNIVLQHALQSASMVGGHQAASYFHFIPSPEGSLPEQLLQAEVTNLQMATGAGFLHRLMPRFSAFQRGLDLRWEGAPRLLFGTLPVRLRPHLAAATEGVDSLPVVYMAAGEEGGGGGRKNSSGSLEGAADPASKTEPSGASERPREGGEEHPENLLARGIYRSIPEEARDMVDLNLLAHKDHPELMGQPLKILAFSLAETLNGLNHLLTYHSEGFTPDHLQDLHAARRWIVEYFDTLNHDPDRNPLIEAYFQALSSMSLHWIHDDFSRLPMTHGRKEILGMLERVPEPSPFNPNLPWLVREIGKYVGGMHREGTLAILSYGNSQGWIDPNEDGFPREYVSAFQLGYAQRYPQGLPPIRQEFLEMFLDTARIVEGLREKWGTGHPFLKGFDYSLSLLNAEPETLFRRFELIQRVRQRLSGGSVAN